MSSYNYLAQFYDSLTTDVPYGTFADFYAEIFKLYQCNPHLLLDLACGTGSLMKELFLRGYDVIGCDMSEDMLMAARENLADVTGMPLLLCQSMQELDLYGTVDAAVCSLDGINYVPPEDLPTVFGRVELFLEPGGVFVFDINSESKLRGLDGQIFIDEKDDVLCIWRASCEANACYYGFDIFSRKGKLWKREQEEHTEYVYTPEELKRKLEEAGFIDVRIFGEFKTSAPDENEQRIFIAARKKPQR